MTARHVLARLEQEGLVTRQQGRGTFVRAYTAPIVLIVEDDPEMLALLAIHVKRAGYNPVAAASPDEAIEALQSRPGIELVFSNIRMPGKEAGIEFIRAV